MGEVSAVSLGTAMERGGTMVARCTELHAYIENNKDALIDYGRRYRR